MVARTPQRRETPPRPAVPTSALLVIEQGKNPIDSVSKTIDNRMDQLVAMYNGDTSMADRMKWVALHALAHPKLLDKLMQADLATVIEALRESASLGLMPIPATAEGYLVPRWNSDKRLYDFTFMPGYRGLVKLIYRSERVAKIVSHVVYEHDEFEYEMSEAYIRHVPKLSDRGQVVATYGKAVILTGGHTESVIEVYDEARMTKTMNSSSSRDKQGRIIGPWIDWPDEMRRKSVLRNMGKTLPLSYVAEEAFRLENEREEAYRLPVTTGEQSRHARLAATVRGRLPSGPKAEEVPEADPGPSGSGEGNGEPPGERVEVCGAIGPGDAICVLPPDHPADIAHEGEAPDGGEAVWG